VATIPLTLYNRYNPGDTVGQGGNQNRFLLNEHGGSPPQPFIAANAGDTLAVSLFFLDDVGGSNPYHFHRYQGATVEVNLSSNNGSVFYGIVTSTTEIVPATGMTVTRLTAGAPSNGDVERQRIVFNGTPLGGTFRIIIQLTSSQGGSNMPHRAGLSADLTFPYNATAADIQAALRALNSYYAYSTAGGVEAGPVDLGYFPAHSALNRDPIVTAAPGGNGFDIQFGSVVAANNTWMPGIPLVQAQDTNIQYPFGYSLSFPLTDANFTQLFRTVNAPAFLDVVLRPSGFSGPAILTGQLPIIASDPSTAPIANFEGNVTNGTAPLTVQFNDLSTNSPTSWAWNFGDGNTSTARNPSHIYASAGSYTVTLTATNAYGSDGETKTGYITVTAPAGGVGETTDAAYVDGNWADPQPVDCPTTEQPFPEQPTAIIYSQRYWQWRLYWAPAPISMGCPFASGAVLIGETPTRSLGGGDLIEWERKFANVPGPIVDAEVINYVYQWYYLLNNQFYVQSMMLTRTAKVTRSFFLTSNPDTIAIARLPRVTVINNQAILTDGFQNLNFGTGVPTIARDDTLTRWNGNIWERTHAEIVL
jgi:hypothetical protein